MLKEGRFDSAVVSRQILQHAFEKDIRGLDNPADPS
jgi:hypothetical protein